MGLLHPLKSALILLGEKRDETPSRDLKILANASWRGRKASGGAIELKEKIGITFSCSSRGCGSNWPPLPEKSTEEILVPVRATA
jgi:hypothetical protein